MEKKTEISSSIDEILIRLFLQKLGYEEEIINKVCDVIW